MKTILDVDGLSFAYGRKQVLANISFSVSEGESVGLLGANGVGKSTLLWCLLGLLRGEGSVRVFGERPGANAARRVGVVFQNPEDQLFMPTLAGDLTLPQLNQGIAPEQARAGAVEALGSAGLAACAGEPAMHLSLGQRKRAAIALALIQRPELLILDEPTSELDGGSVRHLVELLRRLPVSKLITSHQLEFLAKVTSRIVVLHEGRIVAEGPPETIVSNQELLLRCGLI
jgi:cobalt/nickel transport system ATP-binding protein